MNITITDASNTLGTSVEHIRQVLERQAFMELNMDWLSVAIWFALAALSWLIFARVNAKKANPFESMSRTFSLAASVFFTLFFIIDLSTTSVDAYKLHANPEFAAIKALKSK